MRVFVSYSRVDTSFVRQVVERLESIGHDVWIDTDDIVGSERWRSSVAEAITGADVVLLMVSPASMQSSSVEREITVAAEADRRILPVEIEAADVSVGLRYDLAGVQRISFVDRPFDDAMAGLLVAIDTPAAQVSPAEVPSRPAPHESGQRPRVAVWKVGAGLAVVAGLAVAVAMMRDSNDPAAIATESTDPTDDSSVTTNGNPATVEGTGETEFDTTVWFAGYTITATGARFDVDELAMSVDVVIRNDQHIAANPCELLSDDAALVMDGRRITLWSDQCVRLPPATESRATLDAFVGEAVDLGAASIEFGSPEQHQAIIPLDGRPGSSDVPEARSITGTVDGENSSFTAELVEVVPADCSGLSSSLGFEPGDVDEMSIVVTGSATSRNRYPLGYGSARLTLPDGTDLASSSLSGVIYVIDPDATLSDVRACFIVPAPVAGDYRFTIAADGAETFPASISFTW